MSSQTMQAVTEHGSVEYEVVECSSCGMNTTKEHAQRFLIGEMKGEKRWGFEHEVNFETGTVVKGWACQHCQNGDVAGLPSGSSASSGIADSIIQFSVGIAVSVFLLPNEPVRKALKKQGFDNPDAKFLSGLATYAWMVFLFFSTLYIIQNLVSIVSVL
jgi:hypothetical protein